MSLDMGKLIDLLSQILSNVKVIKALSRCVVYVKQWYIHPHRYDDCGGDLKDILEPSCILIRIRLNSLSKMNVKLTKMV